MGGAGGTVARIGLPIIGAAAGAAVGGPAGAQLGATIGGAVGGAGGSAVAGDTSLEGLLGSAAGGGAAGFAGQGLTGFTGFGGDPSGLAEGTLMGAVPQPGLDPLAGPLLSSGPLTPPTDIIAGGPLQGPSIGMGGPFFSGGAASAAGGNLPFFGPPDPTSTVAGGGLSPFFGGEFFTDTPPNFPFDNSLRINDISGAPTATEAARAGAGGGTTTGSLLEKALLAQTVASLGGNIGALARGPQLPAPSAQPPSIRGGAPGFTPTASQSAQLSEQQRRKLQEALASLRFA